MAVVKKNVVTQGLSGTIGDMLVFRQVGNKTIVATVPQQSGPISEKQQVQRSKFQEAALYAKGQLSDPASKAEYALAAKADSNEYASAYTVAVADFLNAPDIKQIDLTHYQGNVGNTILITVTDDFKVTDVQVTISNPDGSLVESGNAVQQANVNDWLYTATVQNDVLAGDKITIRAHDKAGNEDLEEKSI
jgi:hypothetical protein